MVIKTSQEDAFKAAKTVLTLYGAYLNAVAQEIGIDRALALQTRTFDAIGSHQGRMMREQSDIQEHNAQTAWTLMSIIPLSLGIDAKMEEDSPQRVNVRHDKCPVFESAQSLGMDIKSIEAFCQAGPARLMDGMAKQLNPNLNLQIRKFRSSADDFCEEELTLKR